MSTLAERIREGGPGWLQGAMTLGGGSAITSLSIGAMFGYEYLWVQPVAMLIGCVMLLSVLKLAKIRRPYLLLKYLKNQVASKRFAKL